MTQSPLELLLVEDNEGDVEMTRRALRDHADHCHLSIAGDGFEGLQYLRRQGAFAEAARPDLVLLDLNMPRLDGKAFLEAVKGDPQLRAIPIVMLTSSQSASDIRECYERHASCYVVKPFDGAEFEITVRQVVDFWCRVGSRAKPA